GLKAGEHSLQTFHNTFSNLRGRTVTPIKIYLNGEWVQTLNQSNRAFSKVDAATAYLTFQAEANKDVVLRFEGESGFDISEFVINGFEIDTPDLKKQAHSPFPEQADEHVEVDDQLNLTWESPEGTSAYHVYFGMDKEMVKNADASSGFYQGK